MTKTLISTFYSYLPVEAAIYAFSPSKIILVADANSLKKKDVKEALQKVKATYGHLAKIEVVEVPGSNLLAIAKKTIELIENEDKPIVNVSGGWKLLAQGVIYGCYARAEYVSKILCNDIERNTPVELPKLTYGLSEPKKQLLKELADRKGRTIAQIAEKLNRTRGMLYQHLKELKESGYVDEDFQITDAGRLALL